MDINKLLKAIGRVILIALGTAIGFFIANFLCLAIESLFSINLFRPLNILSNSDAISISNTYIVFTTFIFTVVAIFIGILGYRISQESMKSKRASLDELMKELIAMCKENKKSCEWFINELLSNELIVNNFDNKVSEKIDILIKERADNLEKQSQENLKKAKDAHDKAKYIRANLTNGNNE